MYLANVHKMNHAGDAIAIVLGHQLHKCHFDIGNWAPGEHPLHVIEQYTYV